MTSKKSSLSFKFILWISFLVQLTFGATHLFPLQVSNGSSYYYSTGSNDDNLGYTSEKVRGGKAISTTHTYNGNSLNYINPNKNTLNSLNGINANNIDTNDLDSLWSNSDDSLSPSAPSVVNSPGGGGGGGDPSSSSSSNVGYETTGLASTNYGHSYTLGVGHGHVPGHDHHKGQHAHRGWGWTAPIVPIKNVHYQHYPAVHSHYPKGPSHYLNHHQHHHGWNNHGFGGGWNNGYVIGQSFGWKNDFDIWDTVVGWLGLKGVGLASILKTLLIVIPVGIIIIFLILLIPIPFFTQSCARSTASLWSETSRLTQKVLNSDECMERISCELSRMAKKYDQTTWIDTFLKNMPPKYQSTKWMRRISKSLTYNIGDEVDTKQGQRKKGKYSNQENKCSKFVCDPLTQLKKVLMTKKTSETGFQESLEIQSQNLPEPILTTTTVTATTNEE